MKSLLAFVIVARIGWYFTILAGTAYLVFWRGNSGWWWLLAFTLMACWSSSDETEKNKNAPQE